MEWLQNYIVTIAVIGIVSVLADVLLPEGNIKRFARFGISLVLSLALCAPVITLLKQGDLSAALDLELPLTDITSTEEEIENNITRMVQKYSGFESASCSVELNTLLKVQQVTISKNLTEEGVVDSLLHEQSQKNILLLISAVYGVEEANIMIEE